MTVVVLAIAAGASAHSGAVYVVEPLGDRNAFAGVTAIEISRPTDELQVASGGSVDVIVASRGVNHFGDPLADRGDQHVADARGGAAGRRIFAVQDGLLRHVDSYRSHLAVAPGHVPDKRVREGQRNVGHSTG